MVVVILEAVGLWAIVFFPGVAAGGIASRITRGTREILPGVASQATFIMASLAVARFLLEGFKTLGFIVTVCCVLKAIILSGLLATIITTISLFIGNKYNYEPPFLPRSMAEAVLVAFILAPLGEELVYRGVIEGYLLTRASLLTAILIPAILFSLMHIMPFSNAPKPILATILAGALLLGLIAGYYRALSNSIIPAFTSHSTTNVIGLIQYYRVKRAYPGKH